MIEADVLIRLTKLQIKRGITILQVKKLIY